MRGKFQISGWGDVAGKRYQDAWTHDFGVNRIMPRGRSIDGISAWVGRWGTGDPGFVLPQQRIRAQTVLDAFGGYTNRIIGHHAPSDPVRAQDITLDRWPGRLLQGYRRLVSATGHQQRAPGPGALGGFSVRRTDTGKPPLFAAGSYSNIRRR